MSDERRCAAMPLRVRAAGIVLGGWLALAEPLPAPAAQDRPVLETDPSCVTWIVEGMMKSRSGAT